MVFTIAQNGLSRRDLVKGSATLVALTALTGKPIDAVSAQEGTPGASEATGNPFADLGLPELTVMVTDSAYEGVPAELTAGRYVVALTNATSAPLEGVPAIFDYAGAAFVKVPAEFTTDELLAMLAPAPAPLTLSPIAGAEESGLPVWYYEATLAGGPYAGRGETDYAVIDLTAGDWIVRNEESFALQVPVAVRVSGDLPTDLPTPPGGTRVEMSDFAFTFGELRTGRQTLEVANVGVQPHFLGLVSVPDGTTVEDFLALSAVLFGDPSATPPADLGEDDLAIVVDSADQSAGVTAWHSVDLAAGTYVAVCYVIDPESGMPHAMLGMTQIVTVA